MASKLRNRTALTLILCLSLIWAAAAASSASAKTYSFKPARAGHGTVVFLIKSVRPRSVRAARVRIGHHKPHLLGLKKARQAVRRGHLRLHVSPKVVGPSDVAASGGEQRSDPDGGTGGGSSPVERTGTLRIVADTNPPETTIALGPSGSVASQSASFGFKSSDRHSKFQCRLDAGAWAGCDSPKSYSQLAAGAHTFSVRAYDRAGNVDPTPAARTWTVETQPPAEPEPQPVPVPSPEPLPAGALMYDGFGAANGSNNLITNEYAAWHSSDGSAVNSPVWQSDGGSLFSVATTGEGGESTNAAYTGKLDNSSADKYSQTNTHSNKMRFWTKASGFGDVRIDARIKAMSWSPEAPSSWGGFKFYLRRELGVTDSPFYTAEPYIKDGHLYIQKKCLGDTGGGNFVPGEGASPGGTYYILGSKTGYTVPLESWHRIAATVHTNADGSVTIGLYRDGALLLQAVDHGIQADGTGCAPLPAGHVGFRSDFLQYYLDDFQVSPQS
jgi:hypothetical protein